MSATKTEIAQAIMADLAEDKRWLQETRRLVGACEERIEADERWLEVHGFLHDQQQELPVTSTQAGPAEKPRSGPSATIFAIAADVLRSEGSKTLSELHSALVALGKNVHKSSLDSAIRRHISIFEIRKRQDGKNVIWLKKQDASPPLNRA